MGRERVEGRVWDNFRVFGFVGYGVGGVSFWVVCVRKEVGVVWGLKSFVW